MELPLAQWLNLLEKQGPEAAGGALALATAAGAAALAAKCALIAGGAPAPYGELSKRLAAFAGEDGEAYKNIHSGDPQKAGDGFNASLVHIETTIALVQQLMELQKNVPDRIATEIGPDGVALLKAIRATM